jgi:phage nucleotide-binding protein
MTFSYSRVDCHESCPYKYKLRYIDGLRTLPDDDPISGLILGTAMHTGIRYGAQAAVEEYYAAYPIITDDHVTEAMKLEHLIPLARALLPDNGEFEVKVENSDFLDFVGYLDYLTPEGELYDFKYSNHGERYRDSGQLHVYKHFWELSNKGKRIDKLFFLMIPKTSNKKKGEDALDYRRRVLDELPTLEPYLIHIGYDENKVFEFAQGVKNAVTDKTHSKNKTYLCKWCEFNALCEKEDDTMILPSKERRALDGDTRRKLWIYGAPFAGKTTFANAFPDPLLLNTDGNISEVDAPYIPIRNYIMVEGRMTKTKLAWDVFKETIDELEKKQNDFRTIVVDLLEDVYDHCRQYIYQREKITHETEAAYGKGWDAVRTEFLTAMKRLMTLDYDYIILISHEDTTKDITRKGGDKITAVKPNLREAIAGKVAGMVDIVGRVISEGDDRVLSFKTSEVIFGGGRIPVTRDEIPLDYAAFADAIASNAPKPAQEQPKRGRRDSTPPPDETPQSEKEAAQSASEPESPVDDDDSPFPDVEPNTGEVKSEPKPEVRTRKRRV